MTDQRLDQALAVRGLVRSRTQAARLIEAGSVRVDGRVVLRPSHRVADGTGIEVDAQRQYVSRGAHKLLAALDRFGVEPAGRACLDVGASTGGFTHVLLERGARHVVAIDVGHGQLDGTLVVDRRVTSLEGMNARDLTRESLDARLHAGGPPASDRPGGAPHAADLDLVVADLSFISLGHVFEPVARTVADVAEFVVLVKPQFEVGRQGVRDGIVVDPELARDAIERVVWRAIDAGLGPRGVMASPISGAHGNREYLAWFTRGDATPMLRPTEWTERIRELTKGARR